MKKGPSKISGKDLRKLGFPEGEVIGMALKILEAHYKGKNRNQKLELMDRLIQNPSLYKKHNHLEEIAGKLLDKPDDQEFTELKKTKKGYAIFGADGIDSGAIEQMETAMKLPVSIKGALMADAHQGYGLPIGGVLATKKSVIPYGVGVDIGCRMCMTIYDLPTRFGEKDIERMKKMLLENTRFGHAQFTSPRDDEILERKEFNEINILQSLKDKAYSQLGTSGGGNHFVEFGVAKIYDERNEFNIPVGQYLAILSHSGSRGLGANIAQHYTKLAMDACKLPKNAKHLAWLDLDTGTGQEYWQAMNLAGDYASACHHQIHKRMSESLGENPLVMIENHHNFAWKEKDESGKIIIVHRKGATPAGKGVVGIIPGSMTSPGFIVRGKGESSSINSASHGAGRVMSRRKAKELLSKSEVQKHLKKAGVALIGSGLDEAPMVYKDIYKVMEYQKNLVEIIGEFIPKVVRMCGDERFIEVD